MTKRSTPVIPMVDAWGQTLAIGDKVMYVYCSQTSLQREMGTVVGFTPTTVRLDVPHPYHPTLRETKRPSPRSLFKAPPSCP